VKQNRWVIAVAALLVVGAIVLGGCGGSGSQVKRLTKEGFAAKTNQLCRDYRQKTKALGIPKGTTETVNLLGKYKALAGRMVVDLKKLKPPADEQAAVDLITTISEEQLGILDRMITALKRNDTASWKKLAAQGDAMDTESNRIFRQLGVTACAT
jgi:hypothetical protein